MHHSKILAKLTLTGAICQTPVPFSFTSMSSSSPKSAPQLQYGGNVYSQLSNEQQTSIYTKLLKKCHSLTILRQNRHILQNEELPHTTSGSPDIGINDFVATAKRSLAVPKRKVVAISCQFGIVESRRSEPLAICAVDFLTGEILFNSFISFSQPMLNWRTDVHGITNHNIRAAARAGECLRGWEEARAKLFEYIDEQTILVGHTTRSTLELLRLFHTRILDSQIYATSAVVQKIGLPKAGYKVPMYNVCRDFLGITIRHNAQSYQSALESALASREIILHSIQRPEDWDLWAVMTGLKLLQSQGDNREAISGLNNGLDKETDAGPTLATSQVANVFDDGYQTGYQAGYQAAYLAGFEAGFQRGYERGYEKSSPQRDRTRAEGPNNEDEWASSSSDNDNDSPPAVENDDLLAQLMKDDRIREMSRRLNENDEPRATRAAGTAQVKAYLATGVRDAKKEETSRKARIQAKLEALELREKAPEDKTHQKE
ncbi:hypothetical protein V8C35DRAFT_330968 [Trichoderma chlorosporum]